MKRTALLGLTGLCLALVGLWWGWSRLDGLGPTTGIGIATVLDRSPPAASPAGPVAMALPPPPGDEPPIAAAPGRPQADFVGPSFDVVRVGPRGETVIAGRAEPEAEITIYDGASAIARVTADGRGEFVAVLDAPMSPGAHELSLTAQNHGADDVLRSAQVVVAVIPEPGKDVAGRAVAQPSAPLAFATPREGEGPTVVLQVPASGDGAGTGRGAALTLDAIDEDGKGRVVLSGRAAPGASARIYLDNRLIGTVRADERGLWRLSPGQPLAAGSHALRIDQIAPDGRVVARLEAPLTPTQPPAGETAAAQVIVRPGDSLWQLARDRYGAGPRYTTIYETNRIHIRDPDRIYPGQVLTLPTTN